MSSLQIDHPEDGLLLQYIDGELPARKVREVAQHLEACWECRSEVEELQATVADCVRYRRNVLQAHLPDPPNAWPDIYREFARVDASLRRESWKQWFAFPRLKWGLAMAAAAVLVVAVVQQLRQAPAVQAAPLLRRAVSAASARPSGPRRILVQTRSQRMVKVVGAARPARNAERLGSALEERLESAHYDWSDPLSARAYEGWYDQATHKQDEVTTVADPVWPKENCYLIRTSTPEGTLASASLMLRARNLEPVESRLEFRDREWVEFSEIPEESAHVAQPAAPETGSGVRRAEPGSPAPTTGDSSASVSDELQVLAALHEIGADLGDPVEVSLDGGRVVVNGVGVSQQRQKRIHEALDTIPHVEIRFSEPTSSPGSASVEPAVPEPPAAGAKPTGMQARVEQQVGGRAEFERFSSQVLDRNEMMMARAYALRSLAQRFPADQEAALTPQERQALRDLARDDTQALLREATSMERALSPILTAMGGSAATRPAANSSAWEMCAEGLFQASHRVEVLVSTLLGAARGDASTDRLPTDLLTALRDLHAGVEQCQTLLGQ